jgi:hypothetical protein
MFSIHQIVKGLVASKPNVPLKDFRGEDETKICCGCAKEDSQAVTTFLRCSRCKAVFYCSKRCQKLDWIGKQGEGSPTRPRKHQDLCSELAEAKQEFRDNKDAGEALRTTLFSSWANQHNEESGVFYEHEFLARKNLLGQLDVGFWALPDVLTPWSIGKDHTGFQNGQMLLEESFFPLQKGWTGALKQDEYPSAPTMCPPPVGGLQCWDDYLTFRNIAKTSVSPLLLTNVLTVYQMIFHELKLHRGKKKGELRVMVLGSERELNQIPLFEELAYLIPGIDLTLVFVSPATKAICDEALTRPRSLIRKNEYILDFHAPPESGSGRIRIELDSSQEYFFTKPDHVPDAAVGLNAGLASYPQWSNTMHMLLRLNIPFCFTDCAKLSLRYAEVIWLTPLIENINRQYSHWPPLPVPRINIKLNPFNGVVNRDVAAVRVPNISNGYLFTSTY